MSRKELKAVSVVPFEINNLGSFLGDSTYPVLNPFTKPYDDYWTARTSECIYGLWGDDSKKDSEHGFKKIGGYRWLPGNMVFHTQHCVIELEKKGRRNKGTGRPLLRDVEWLVGYDLATCDGFSGFEDDNEYTCFRPIQKLQRGEELSPSDEILIEMHAEHLFTKQGTYKKYIDARELLYKTHNEPLGKPLWANEAQNYMLLSTRRLGKSYIIINGVAVYEFCFNGARTLEELWSQETSSVTVVGSGVSDKTKEFFDKWHKTYNHLLNNVGAYNDGRGINESGAFWWKYRGSVAEENGFLSNSVKVEGGVGYTGPGSNIWHVTYGQSSSKGAGTSLNNAIVEEVGLTKEPETIHAENSPAQESDWKFGKSIYIGTGGDFKKIEGSRKMFYTPSAYSILACKNVFQPGSGDTARFIPATYAKNQFRNENGMQDIQRALIDLMITRDKKEKADTRQYLHHMASYPTTPDEIFVKYDGNEFPIKNLEKRRHDLKSGVLPYSTGKIGFMDEQNLEAYWMEDFDLKPLMDIDDLIEKQKEDDTILNLNKEGCMVQYEAPNKDRPKRVYNDRNPMYLSCVEPVRNDKGSSYFYNYIWKFDDFANPDRIQHNIVFEWFGRFDNNNTKNFKRAMDIAAYYGCNIFCEINNDGIKAVARGMHRYDWLQPRLGHIEGLEVNSKTDYDVGFYVLPKMNIGLEKLVDEFLRSRVDVKEKIVGEEYIREEVIMADVLNSQMVVSQCIDYNREGNFDAYDGLRLIAVWYKGNQKAENQYAKHAETKKLLDTMRGLNNSRYTNKQKQRYLAKR